MKIINSPQKQPQQGFPGQNKDLIYETEAVYEIEHAQTAPPDQYCIGGELVVLRNRSQQDDQAK